jgi:hypothetical protein
MHTEGEVGIDKVALCEPYNALADVGFDFLIHKPACHNRRLAFSTPQSARFLRLHLIYCREITYAGTHHAIKLNPRVFS